MLVTGRFLPSPACEKEWKLQEPSWRKISYFQRITTEKPSRFWTDLPIVIIKESVGRISVQVCHEEAR